MAIAFVNSCSGAGTQNGVTSSAMDTTGANLIVVSVAAYSSLGSNLTDSESNTWTALSSDSNGTSLERIFYCISPTTSSSHTFTFNQSSTYPSIAAIAFSGVSAFDSENTSTQSSSSTTIQTGSVTPPVDGCLVFAGVCSAQGAIVTAIDSGFTLETAIQHVSAVNMGSGSAYLIQSSASPVNPQITSSSSNYLAASIAVFKPAKTGLGDEKLWLCPSLDDSADDISGNGNHGTYNGGMGTVADVSNGGTRAYFFDATDDYISSFPTAITSFVGDPAGTSVSCWIKKAATGTDPIFIATLGGSSNGWYGQVLVTLSGAKKELLIKSLGVLDYIDSQDADDTDWHHYAISFDASRNATFYYDGASKGTAAVASPGTSGIALQIGGRAGAIDLVSMYVDDYRIFDGELTLSEAQALASKRGYEVPAASSGSTPHPLSAPIFHPLG